LNGLNFTVLLDIDPRIFCFILVRTFPTGSLIMSVARPRTSFCTALGTTTTHFVAQALSKFGFFTLKDWWYRTTPADKAGAPIVPYFETNLSTDAVFHSEDAKKSETFAKTIDAATAALKKDAEEKIKKGEKPSYKIRVRIAGQTDIVVCKAADFANLYINNARHFDDKESINTFGHFFNTESTNLLKRFFGITVPMIMALSSKDERYGDVRRLFQAVFLYPENLSALYSVLQEICGHLINEFKDQKTINLKDFVSRLNQGLIFQGVIKAKKVSMDDIRAVSKCVGNGVKEAVKMESIAHVALADSLHLSVKVTADTEMEKGSAIIKKILKENVEPIRKDPGSWMNLQRADKTKALTDEEIISDNSVKAIAFLVVAGSHTTSDFISHVIRRLIENPAVLLKLLNEIAELGIDPKDMTFEHIMNMPQLLKILIEALRLDPPLPIQKIRVMTEFTMHDGVKVPAGSQIYLNVGELQRDPDVYKNPDEFNPDRFEKDAEKWAKVAIAKKKADDEKKNRASNPSSHSAPLEDTEKQDPSDAKKTERDEALLQKYKLKYLQKFLEQRPPEFEYEYAFQAFGRLRMCPGRRAAILSAGVAITQLFHAFALSFVNRHLTVMKTFGASLVSADGQPVELNIDSHEPLGRRMKFA
jgi:cytochrome P450